MKNTAIEWSDATWNPVTGCTKISPGCKHCYAENIAHRFRGTKAYPLGFDVRTVYDRFDQPLSWKSPKRIFVNSMSDFFHEEITDGDRFALLRTMQRAGWHRYQILTKRAEGMARFLRSWADRRNLLRVEGYSDDSLEHLWFGVSVEDQKFGVPRIKHLQDCEGINRFLSIEPLLEDVGTLDLKDIHWVILGGESGAKARPMEQSWARSVRDQCLEAGVPFFFKQWGGRIKTVNWRVLDGREWNEFPPGLQLPLPARVIADPCQTALQLSPARM
jgi:protein gp37